MSVAEKLVPTSGELLSWGKICLQHPGEWVCLLDVESANDGSIRSARVIAHHCSMKQVLTRIGTVQPAMIVVHTSGRPLQSPRLEMTDEIRDRIRPRR